MPMEIRKALRSDLPAILALHVELELAGRQTLALPEAERIFTRMQSYPDYSIYVAEIDGEIAGTFALLIMDNLAHMGAPSGIVEDVVVHPQRQGQGIGKALMRFAMAQCAQAGCYKLALSSNMQRQGAHEFYKSLGFALHGYSFSVALDAAD